MSWQACFPTQVFFGEGAINEHANILKMLGTKALVVTGQGGSAERNGALQDIDRALHGLSIGWELYNQVEANPSVDTIRKGARLVNEMEVDFVIGIGGGSPMDAAKAIAIKNLDQITDAQLFDLKYGEAYPIVLIPTTAGTGSEVTPASILTSHRDNTKRNIGSAKLIPRAAFLDPRYTASLPWQITADTAVDAYSHAIESCLSIKNNRLSSLYSHEAMKILGQELRLITQRNELSPEHREALLYASYLAGVAISMTGTSIPHAIGYSLTYYEGITHGRANGLIMPAWLEFNYEQDQSARTASALQISSFSSMAEFKEIIQDLCGPVPVCSLEKQQVFLQHALEAKNTYNNLISPQAEDIIKILNSSLSGL